MINQIGKQAKVINGARLGKIGTIEEVVDTSMFGKMFKLEFNDGTNGGLYTPNSIKIILKI